MRLPSVVFTEREAVPQSPSYDQLTRSLCCIQRGPADLDEVNEENEESEGEI